MMKHPKCNVGKPTISYKLADTNDPGFYWTGNYEVDPYYKCHLTVNLDGRTWKRLSDLKNSVNCTINAVLGSAYQWKDKPAAMES